MKPHALDLHASEEISEAIQEGPLSSTSGQLHIHSRGSVRDVILCIFFIACTCLRKTTNQLQPNTPMQRRLAAWYWSASESEQLRWSASNSITFGHTVLVLRCRNSRHLRHVPIFPSKIVSKEAQET